MIQKENGTKQCLYFLDSTDYEQVHTTFLEVEESSPSTGTSGQVILV